MIAIVDYRAGNLTSVRLAFEALGCPAVVTSDAGELRAAERVVFPGVGAAGAAMENLRSLGLETPIREILARGTPFLGICLGMQILFSFSEEDGGTECLGILPGKVRRFAPVDRWDKVPEIGWNQVEAVREHPLFNGIAQGSEFYFVHSYYVQPYDDAPIVAKTQYADASFSSAIARGSLAAVQFHPEKSGRVGLKLLRNFLEWEPEARC